MHNQNYKGYYICPCGRVYSYKQNKFLKSRPNQNGYEIITLRQDNKSITKTIHRLVAETYLENPENKPQIDHIDGNKRNNKLNNLHWATICENNNNPITLKKMAATKRKKCICVETGKVYDSTKEAANDLNIAPSTIRASIYYGYKIKHQWRFIYA